MTSDEHGLWLGRRAFLQQGTLLLLAAKASVVRLRAEDDAPRLRVGLVTDLHYADKAPNGTRHYRETLSKLEEAAAELEWLEGDLKASDQPVVVFAHQRLDVNNSYGIKNQAAVRKVLETSGKVL
ncbi:MAG: hypothetical protein RIS70_3461, partial [Planctomycetota bacterium]